MAKKGILHGMGFGKGRLRSWMWGAVLLFYSLLYSPIYVQAEMCPGGIDYNKPTIAAATSTIGLKEDGTVLAVGDSNDGGLNVSDWNNITAVAADWRHTVGLKKDGTVVAVGDPWWDGRTNVSDWANIKAIAAGGGYTIGIKEDGTVVAVGSGWGYGNLNVSGWTNIKAIAAGGYPWSSLAAVGLKEEGTVVTAGGGQLDWTNIKAIAVGWEHIVGLKEDGTVVGLWPAYYGQLNVSDWTNIKAIAANGVWTLGLKEDGTVVAAYPEWYGQLNVSGWANITAIAVGFGHAVGLKEDGTVVAVGSNWYGELNVSDWTNIRQPTCLNNPPVASAGPDQTIECAGPSGSSVTLNGSASSDPDGDQLTYTWTWPGGSTEGVNPTVSLPLGTTTVALTVSDGKSSATDTVNITVQDTIPPVTTATGGSENWYNANVISTFSGTDSCSGVKGIHYTINGTEIVVSGDSASLTLTNDGTYNIAYYSIDNAGNAESPNSTTIKIDKTPPVLDLSTNPNILWSPNHKMVDVLISGSATDVASGIGTVTFSVTDEYGIIQPSISNFNATIQLEASREGSDEDGRLYTISAVASDAAGNKTTAYTTVLVPHDQGNE